eukprot:362814-Chlamydomonas_euryale.AAC.1
MPGAASALAVAASHASPGRASDVPSAQRTAESEPGSYSSSRAVTAPSSSAARSGASRTRSRASAHISCDSSRGSNNNSRPAAAASSASAQAPGGCTPTRAKPHARCARPRGLQLPSSCSLAAASSSMSSRSTWPSAPTQCASAGSARGQSRSMWPRAHAVRRGSMRVAAARLSGRRPSTASRFSAAVKWNLPRQGEADGCVSLHPINDVL